MTIEKSKIINVLNYNENPVCIATHTKEYLCQPMDNGSPSITPLDFSEVEYLNSNSLVFKIGMLFFEDEVKEDVYTALRIVDWKDILTNEDIKDMLLNPTLEGLTKIISINSVMLFERIRGIFFSLKNSNLHDISTRVEKIINTRYKELCNHQLKTKIILTAKDTTSPVAKEEVNDLKKQNELLQQQMLQMQEMMAKLLESQKVPSMDNPKESEVEEEKPKTGRGRKPKEETEK